MNNALQDLVNSIKMLPMSLFFAWGDTLARYHRSVLGPIWLVLGTAIGTIGLGILWAKLLHIELAMFIPSLAIGLVVWQLIAGSVIEGSTALIKNSKLIRNVKTPYLVFPVQVLLRQIINFLHNFSLVVLVLIVFPPSLNWSALLLIPNLFLVIMNLLWMILLLGMFAARYRDIEQLVTAAMPILFFLSPVIYQPEQLGAKAALVWINPFSYMISLLRYPLQGAVCPTLVYTVMILMLISGWLFALWVLNKKYARIAFWV